MAIKEIKFVLILCLLFSFIISSEEDIPEIIEPSEEVRDLEYNTTKESYKGKAENAFKVQRYRLNFGNISDIPEYIRFKLSSNDFSNKVISFSTEDDQGKTDRIQLAQLGTQEEVISWIKKDQLATNKEFLYIVVECQIEEGKVCNYLMDIKGEENITFNSPNFNYNFYVNEKNQEMEFIVFNDKPNKGQILTVYATGGKPISIKIELDNGQSFDGENLLIGQALTVEIKPFKYFILKIKATEGDYITLGSKLYIDEKSNMNVLKSNGYQITGFLKNGTLEQECYEISNNSIDYNRTSFIVGLFYNKEGKIYYKDEYLNVLEEENPITTTKGYYSYNYSPENNTRKYICISFPDEEMETLAYTLQFIQPGKHYGFPNLFVPQSNGYIYPRILEKGSYAFFNAINLNPDSEEIIYNMIIKEGLPTMYIYKCDNYPLCEFDENYPNMTKINEINLMSIWYSREKTSPIDSNQYVMFVKCEDLKDNNQTDICQFYTSIYGNLDKIFLIEGETFSQYILKGKNSNYYIDISSEQNVKEIHLDILIINGDISLKINDTDDANNDIAYDKYILSNKIFYRIHLDEKSNLKRVVANINAKMNSYYIIEYKLIKVSDDEYSNDMHTGINYLISIPKGNKTEKIIKIHRTKLLEDESYFTSFYSLNCRYNIFREEGNGNYFSIQSYGNYGEDIILTNENKMKGEENIYSYKIKLIDDDKSSYNSDMCMLYVSSIELMNEQNYDLQKEILISEGIPQRIHFMKRDYKIKYIYPYINKDKDVVINFVVINSANYTYTITFNHKKKETDYFAQSRLVYLNQNRINENCEKDDEICNIIVSIDLAKEIENDGNTPIIEISIREIGNIPLYLPIGVAKIDFLSGTNKLNLFTTLGKEDQGFITIDFARGSGLIYAKIVPIDGDGDKNQEWRQYELPNEKNNNLKYDFYNKKMLIETENTELCENGCYLLISIESSTTGSLDENFRAFQLSITVNLIPKGDLRDNGPIIQIQPEQYIIGSLTDGKRMENQDMYEFYQLNIPFDAKTVEIDWQSDSTTFLLDIGQERPLIDNNQILKKLESRNDTIIIITNEEIKKKLGPQKNITNAYLTIGVYSEFLESPYGNSYSFRVHFTKDINIYKVDSDQKTLCRPEEIGNNEYRCLFMVIYKEFDFIYDTMVYAKSQSLSALTFMYGEFIESKIYDYFDEDNLSKNIPTDGNSTYNTKRDKIDFIFITLPKANSHFYVSVISDKPDIIEFISSFKTFDDQLSPNPSSVQLFTINNGPSINLKFKTTKPLLINIVSLYGSLKLHFLDDANVEYSLRGRDDRISLAIPNDGNEENLIIENINYCEEDKDQPIETTLVEIPKIAFYIDYYLRTENLNLDEIKLGKTSEIAYKKSDFPIYYFSKLDGLEKDINIFFNFHDLEFTYDTKNRMMSPDDISIKANIVSQKTVYKIRNGAESTPNNDSIEGKFDPSLQAGYLFLSSDSLKKLNNFTDPTLYLSFEKKNNDKVFKKIRLELTAYEKNSEIPVTEKIYQYGNIKSDEIVSYKLKVDNYTGDMRIQFAANSRNIDFSLNNLPNQKSNNNSLITNLEQKEERGKFFVTFNKPKADYIYINIFAKNTSTDSRLNNYAFKYMNSIDRQNFFEYPFLNNGYITANYEKSNSSLRIRFNRINKANVDLTYSLKISKKWDKSEEELNQTIAFTEYSPTVMQIYNPSGEEINMEIENIELNQFSYLTVIAQIKDGPIIEYVAYDPVYEINYTDIDDKTDIPGEESDEPKDGSDGPEEEYNKNEEEEYNESEEKPDEDEKPKENENENADDDDNDDSGNDGSGDKGKGPGDDGDGDDDDDDDDDKVLIIIVSLIGGVIIVILIILVVTVLLYNRKTKDLLQQVNKISFADGDGDTKDKNENLLLEDNELK